MKAYIEESRKAVEVGKRFKHVMAAVLNPATNYKNGIIRCITSRKSDVRSNSFVDKSELYKIEADAFGYLKIGERLVIKNEKEIVDQVGDKK